MMIYLYECGGGVASYKSQELDFIALMNQDTDSRPVYGSSFRDICNIGGLCVRHVRLVTRGPLVQG